MSESPMRPSSQACEAVIGYFVFGPQTCGRRAVVAVTCEDWPGCDKKHPVCDEHSTSSERDGNDHSTSSTPPNRGGGA